MKITLITSMALILTTFAALCEHPSLRGSALNAEDIYSSMFDLEGEVIKIDFPSDNPKQISKEFFSLNYGSGNHVAVVLLPSEVAKKYFKQGSRASLPRTLFVEVSIGELVNAFGATEQGPILLGVGTRVRRSMQGEADFQW